MWPLCDLPPVGMRRQRQAVYFKKFELLYYIYISHHQNNERRVFAFASLLLGDERALSS
jgi:hypothetical protein